VILFSVDRGVGSTNGLRVTLPYWTKPSRNKGVGRAPAGPISCISRPAKRALSRKRITASISKRWKHAPMRSRAAMRHCWSTRSSFYWPEYLYDGKEISARG